jgi:hypothetical protein
MLLVIELLQKGQVLIVGNHPQIEIMSSSRLSESGIEQIWYKLSTSHLTYFNA